MTTSREALKLQQEWLYTVNGLSTPPEDMLDSDKLYSLESTRLFVEQVQKINPNFRIENAFRDIIRICLLILPVFSGQ